ncbi:hypothetical protein [Chitinophaga sp. YIM B06452]|uniref:hypothetical protein n=1 Tax=Chitinophaga sp. YIM B06452 TaxID=3082158 RepID=UPI0031FF1D6E
MNLKEEFVFLVKKAKENEKKAGRRLTNQQIGEKLNVGGTYISGLLGGSKDVSKKHVEDFKSHFKDQIAGVVPTVPFAADDPENIERAQIVSLQRHLAWIMSEVSSLKGKPRSYEDCLTDIEKSTTEELVNLRRSGRK